MEAKAQDGDQERVENQIRAVWPKDLLGKFKSTSRRPDMWAPFAKIGEFVQRKQLDEKRKDMENIISVAEAHAGRYDNKIVKKKKKNMITGDKLEEVRGARRTYFAGVRSRST